MTIQKIDTQIAYALPNTQCVIDLKVDLGTKAIDAVHQSGILEKFPELKARPLKLGIFSKIISHDTKLGNAMRVEIYRPLIADPKETRRQRARSAKRASYKKEV